MKEPSRVSLRWVVVPGFLTLAITLVRLWGELQGWSTNWFGVEPGGQSAPASGGNQSPPSLLGIFWLMPLMGIYFGFRLGSRGHRPASRLAALLLPVLGVVVLMGAFAILLMTREFTGEEPDLVPVRDPSFLYGLAGVAVAGWVGVWIAKRGWPEMFRLSLAYGFAARIPVVVITFVLCPLEKGTHYEKLAPFAPDDLSKIENAIWLSVAQVGLWIPATILLGMICGALVAFVRRPAPAV